MSSTENIDAKYYQAASRRSLGERLTVLARDRIFDDFVRIAAPRPRDAVLDVGVSDVVNDAANVLERRYGRPERITAVGLGDGAGFQAAYPRVTYRRIEPNRPLPFPDRAFELATSNAVLEHVGSRQHQIAFVRELVRVSRKVFVTVPNRFFPIEHHTAIPLLHYWDAGFARACAALGKEEWASEENLILMSRRSLAALAPPGIPCRIGYTGIALGPFSSNIFMFLDRG
jgi:hypothetical protein